MKNLSTILAVLALGLVFTSTANAELMCDDFTTPTLGNYTQGDYQTNGANGTVAYTIDTVVGKLVGTLVACTNDSDRLMHNTASLAVGESLEIGILSITDHLGNRAGILLSSIATPENLSGAHYIMRMDSRGSGNVRVRLALRNAAGAGTLYTGADVTAAAMTFRIDRTGTDDYKFYVDDSLVYTDTDSFAASYVGVETYRGAVGLSTDTGEYDFIQIVPEPSTFVLLAIAGLGLLLWCWRKRSAK